MPKTVFTSLADVSRLIVHRGLPAVLKEVEDRIRQDFLHWGEFQKTPRIAFHHCQGVVELMPVSDSSRFAFKYVNGHPYNPSIGLPTVMAFGLLSEMTTGTPLLLSEMSLLTAIRTAATSVLAARLLARDDSKSMAIIGNGAQSEFQALAFFYGLGINTFRLYDIDPLATDKLIHNLRQTKLPLTLIPCSSSFDAVDHADIITTITADKAQNTIIENNWVAPGTHLNAVGGDCPGKTELDRSLVLRSTILCEFEPQSRIEGELQQVPPHIKPYELPYALARHGKLRSNNSEVTLFDSVGFALEDFSILQWLHAQLEYHPLLGTPLDLVAQPSDPKNLWHFSFNTP